MGLIKGGIQQDEGEGLVEKGQQQSWGDVGLIKKRLQKAEVARSWRRRRCCTNAGVLRRESGWSIARG